MDMAASAGGSRSRSPPGGDATDPAVGQNPCTGTSTGSGSQTRRQAAAGDAPRKTRATALVFGVGSGIASSVYGTITAMATIAAFGDDEHPWKIAVAVALTAVVFWVAHMYAHGISESIAGGHPLRLRDLGPIARRERGIVLAALPPLAALLLGAAGVLHEGTAIWLALVIGLATLAIQGARYARLEEAGVLSTLVAVAANVGLGLLVVALKAALAH
jgi:hypothetical protein